MRCDECGRPMKNAELWQLAGDPNAPTSSSMRQLCWECRDKVAKAEGRDASDSVVVQAAEIARQHDAPQV
ncbi:MAG TPA: hypothetical protein VKQ30_02375 [Ktedonobacterales bacterium]|nr:hypothetical protein [Ktedonobacterales bacterium]